MNLGRGVCHIESNPAGDETPAFPRILPQNVVLRTDGTGIIQAKLVPSPLMALSITSLSVPLAKCTNARWSGISTRAKAVAGMKQPSPRAPTGSISAQKSHKPNSLPFTPTDVAARNRGGYLFCDTD
jgi:hypothetical protein